MMYLFIFILKLALTLVCILLSVAFMTLFERKSLSYMQLRVGPNKWGFKGLFQPFSDAAKLFTKGVFILNFSNLILYIFSPLLMLSLVLITWFSFPSILGDFGISMTIIFIMCCLSVSVYPILSAGWAANSKFPLIGSLRAVAQTISYEVSFALAFLSLVLVSSTLSLDKLFNFTQVNLFIMLPLGILWFISILAETNRTPFDFSEGESELVSGFNTEFMAGPFAMFFLAEYASILFMSFLFSVLFLMVVSSGLLIMLETTLMIYMFLWVRGTLPRMRYDKLMMLAWKVFLPMTLSYLIFLVGLILTQLL